MSRKAKAAPIAPLLMPVHSVPVKSIFIDSTYQRRTDEKHAKHIAENFDPHAFQVLEVSARSDGRFAVFDGGHRHRVAEILKFSHVDCRVHTGLTLADECELYNMLQTERRKLSDMDLFKADLVREYAPAVRIKSITDAAGFSIGEPEDGHVLNSVPTLYTLDKLGVLPATLATIHQAWGHMFRVKADELHGVGLFHVAHVGDIDPIRLRSILRDFPSQLRGRMWEHKRTFLKPVRNELAFARTLEHDYAAGYFVEGRDGWHSTTRPTELQRLKITHEEARFAGHDLTTKTRPDYRGFGHFTEDGIINADGRPYPVLEDTAIQFNGAWYIDKRRMDELVHTHFWRGYNDVPPTLAHEGRPVTR